MEGQEKRRLRDEVAELAQAVKKLREQLTWQQHHACCHHYYTPVPWQPNVYYPPTITCSGGYTIQGVITT